MKHILITLAILCIACNGWAGECKKNMIIHSPAECMVGDVRITKTTDGLYRVSYCFCFDCDYQLQPCWLQGKYGTDKGFKNRMDAIMKAKEIERRIAKLLEGR